MEEKNLNTKGRRRYYFLQRTLFTLISIILMFSQSINFNFLDGFYSRDEVFFFTLVCFVPAFIWSFYLDKRKRELGITEVVFPKRRVIIERTDDVNENIRRYKIAEKEEIARVIEERKKHTYFQRLWKRLNV